MASVFSNIGAASKKGFEWNLKDAEAAKAAGKFIFLTSQQTDGKKHLHNFNIQRSWTRTSKPAAGKKKTAQRPTYADVFIGDLSVFTATGQAASLPVRVMISEPDFVQWFPTFRAVAAAAGAQIRPVSGDESRLVEEILTGQHNGSEVFSLRILYGNSFFDRMKAWNLKSVQERAREQAPQLTAQEQAALTAALANPNSPQSRADVTEQRDAAAREGLERKKEQEKGVPASKQIKNYKVDDMFALAQSIDKKWEHMGKSTTEFKTTAGGKKVKDIKSTISNLVDEATTHFLDITNVIDPETRAVNGADVAAKRNNVKVTKGKESRVLTDKYTQFAFNYNGTNLVFASRAKDGLNADRIKKVVEALGQYTPEFNAQLSSWYDQNERQSSSFGAAPAYVPSAGAQQVGGNMAAFSPPRQ